MSKADKRERQRINRERARLERERLMRRGRRLRALRGLLIVLVPVAIVFAIVVVTRDEGSDTKKQAASGEKKTWTTAPPNTIDPAKTYTATFDTTEGSFVATLDPKQAPVATNNFVFLARQGFYDGLQWVRAAKNFVIQTGSPDNTQAGGPGYSVQGELPTDNYPVGSLAAAKAGNEAAGTFGSQIFVVTGPNGATLPNDYARFGMVTEGLDVAQKIESYAPASGDGKPTKKVVVTKLTIAES